ncbi:hypothetical protein [Phaffia rhodozyma]|uniref:Uncharacterized protein n=1 Tax=Phaffia rhodozyma TaxID=264483 RepID=A0A0F7STJ8_PHARH|nr:hypothetical protein [Phaffia rhodozyma]
MHMSSLPLTLLVVLTSTICWGFFLFSFQFPYMFFLSSCLPTFTHVSLSSQHSFPCSIDSHSNNPPILSKHKFPLALNRFVLFFSFLFSPLHIKFLLIILLSTLSSTIWVSPLSV